MIIQRLSVDCGAKVLLSNFKERYGCATSILEKVLHNFIVPGLKAYTNNQLIIHEDVTSRKFVKKEMRFKNVQS